MNEWIPLQVQGDETSEVGHLFDLLAQLDAPWRRKAACRGLDPNLFFPERGATPKEARETCAGCTVRVECGEYALETGARCGIWGGRSERERRRIRRDRREAA